MQSSIVYVARERENKTHHQRLGEVTAAHLTAEVRHLLGLISVCYGTRKPCDAARAKLNGRGRYIQLSTFIFSFFFSATIALRAAYIRYSNGKKNLQRTRTTYLALLNGFDEVALHPLLRATSIKHQHILERRKSGGPYIDLVEAQFGVLLDL